MYDYELKKMEEKRTGKSYKGKTHACMFTMHLVKGTESDMERNEHTLVMRLKEQPREEGAPAARREGASPNPPAPRKQSAGARGDCGGCLALGRPQPARLHARLTAGGRC